MIIYTHVTGCYVFDERGVLKEKREFSPDEALNYSHPLEEGEWLDIEKNLIRKYPGSFFLGSKKAKLADCRTTLDCRKIELISQVLDFARTKEFNTIITKSRVRDSVHNDSLIIQTISQIDELNKASNMLAKRLREWYELYNPEFSKSIYSHEKFVAIIIEKQKPELLAEIGVKQELSMGADLDKQDVAPIIELAKHLKELYSLKEEQAKYLERIMQKTCPNVQAVTGTMLGAKLLSLAGSLVQLAELPSSTIQLLGAEKALFRHIRSGSKAPKHGILVEHPLVMEAKNKGKAARMMANKIGIAAKVDLYKGEFIGDKLKADLEKKLK